MRAAIPTTALVAVAITVPLHAVGAAKAEPTPDPFPTTRAQYEHVITASLTRRYGRVEFEYVACPEKGNFIDDYQHPTQRCDWEWGHRHGRRRTGLAEFETLAPARPNVFGLSRGIVRSTYPDRCNLRDVDDTSILRSRAWRPSGFAAVVRLGCRNGAEMVSGIEYRYRHRRSLPRVLRTVDDEVEATWYPKEYRYTCHRRGRVLQHLTCANGIGELYSVTLRRRD